jgi:hypothetical protein
MKYTNGTWGWGPEVSVMTSITDEGNSASADSPEQVPKISDSIGGAETDSVGLTEFSTFEDGETAIIDAVVTLPPGIAGKSVFAVRDSEAEVGAFVRMYGSGPYPQLQKGDSVRIIGRIKSIGSVKLATTAREVSKTSSSIKIAPFDVAVADIGSDFSGLELTVSGLVARRTKRTLTIADDAGSAEIVARITSDETPESAPGQKIAVTGVVRSTSSGFEILVADSSAFVLSEPPSAEVSVASDEEPSLASEDKTNRLPLDFSAAARKAIPNPWVSAGAIVTVGVLGYGLWRKRMVIEDDIDGL